MPKNPPKAYKDINFLESDHARDVRIIAEYELINSRFEKHNIKDTITFFGSARTLSKVVAEKNYKKSLKNKSGIEKTKTDLKMSMYYEKTRELSFKLTKWARKFSKKDQRFVICTGGGPGIMEAANRGAIEAGGKSIGLGISLPFEQLNNKYITPGLNFEFHYFFLRKFWGTYPAKATVMMPGGFGTCDEFMEILTLKQTGKISKPMPIVLFGTDYWNKLINFDEFVKNGTISPKDLKLFKPTNSVNDAYKFITNTLEKKLIRKPGIYL